VDLGDRVVGSTFRAEPVGARVEVRLEDRFQDQLERGLHHSVRGGRNSQAAELPAALGDHPLPDRQRRELTGLHLLVQAGKEGPLDRLEQTWANPVDPGRSCSLIAPHPIPSDHQERRVGDEVEQVSKHPARVVAGPLVQFGLDLQYPLPGAHNSSAEIGSSIFTVAS